MYNIYGNPFNLQALGLQQPNMPQPLQMMQGPTQLNRVPSIDAVKAFQMAPNSSGVFFLESEDIFYIKSTDGAGFATINSYKFEPLEEPQQKPGQYVTVEEFEAFKQEILQGVKDGK